MSSSCVVSSSPRAAAVEQAGLSGLGHGGGLEAAGLASPPLLLPQPPRTRRFFWLMRMPGLQMPSVRSSGSSSSSFFSSRRASVVRVRLRLSVPSLAQ